MKTFEMKEQYYSFNYQNVHFLALSTETESRIGSEQYNFAKSDLENVTATRASIAQTSNATAPQWTVVYFHKPMFTSPTNHPNQVKFRETYQPLFDAHHVDLVLQAHNHNYQRSYPLRFNSAESSSPIVADSNLSQYANPNAPVYTVVGTGGMDLYNFDGKASYMITQNKTHGFLNIDMLDNGTALNATFFSNDGTKLDSFSIHKTNAASVPEFLPTGVIMVMAIAVTFGAGIIASRRMKLP
jgi:hypothetical protein